MLLRIFGFISLSFGLLGLFVPLLPTTPFIILSAFFFAKSSPEFHYKMLNHQRLGPIIEDWNKSKKVPLKAKILASFMIFCSVGMIYLSAGYSFGFLLLVFLLLIILSFIWLFFPH